MNPGEVTVWFILAAPVLALAAVGLTAGKLLRRWRIAPPRPVSRRLALLAVVFLVTFVAIIATVYGQLLDLFLGEPAAQGMTTWAAAPARWPQWLGVVWILSAEFAPPLVVTMLVAGRVLPRDRLLVVVLGGVIAVLPQLALLLLYLWFMLSRPYGFRLPSNAQIWHVVNSGRAYAEAGGGPAPLIIGEAVYQPVSVATNFIDAIGWSATAYADLRTHRTWISAQNGALTVSVGADTLVATTSSVLGVLDRDVWS